MEKTNNFVFVEFDGRIMPFDEYKTMCRERLDNEGAYQDSMKALDYLIIKTHDGKYLKIWKRNLPEAEFEAAQRAAAKVGKDWRCPTRHECIDIYDARFKGLDIAMREIEGNSLTGDCWTCEADSDSQFCSALATHFDASFGFLGVSQQNFKYLVRPVLAFEINA